MWSPLRRMRVSVLAASAGRAQHTAAALSASTKHEPRTDRAGLIVLGMSGDKHLRPECSRWALGAWIESYFFDQFAMIITGRNPPSLMMLIAPTCMPL